MSTGTVGWIDLTVKNVTDVKAFYQGVVGWEAVPVNMGDYDDFSMRPVGKDQPVTGICHARGVNAELPPVWMVYFVVDDLDASLSVIAERGGRVVSGPRAMGKDRYCVIEDPAGAVCALYQKGE